IPIHGFDDEPQCAQGIGPPLRARVDIARRNHDGRNMILLLHLFKKAQAVHPRHIDIGYEKRELFAREQIQCLRSVAGHRHSVPHVGEQFPHEFQAELIIVSDKYFTDRGVSHDLSHQSDPTSLRITPRAGLSRGRNAEYNKKVEEGSGGGKNGFHIFIDRITFASALHDIGKVGIQDSILLKPGPLTQNEFETMKTHTTLGGSSHAAIQLAESIAMNHHEQSDGKDYAGGMKKEDKAKMEPVKKILVIISSCRKNR